MDISEKTDTMKPETRRYLKKLALRLEGEYLAMRALHYGNLPAWRVAMRSAGSKFPRKKNPAKR
jgi:hypothetical protein